MSTDSGPEEGARPPPLSLPAHIRRRVEAVADVSAPVLLTGETGTGKSIVAREIHALSPRATMPFVKIDCGGLVSTLARAELYGNERGAWTGADTTRRGLIREANGGSAFFDEIGVLPFEDQAALLTVLEERRVRPVGGTRYVKVEARVICATNDDLQALVREKRFRADLYYRCNVLPVELPPLRERRHELPAIVTFLLHQIARVELGNTSIEVGPSRPSIPSVAPEVMALFRDYGFPGNIRELRSILLEAILHDRKRIRLEHLPARVLASGLAELTADRQPTVPQSARRLRYRAPPLEDDERKEIVRALRNAQSVRGAARLLDMSRTTLYERISRFAIRKEQWKGWKGDPAAGRP